MKRQFVQEMGRSPRFTILELLRCSEGGLPVDDLATKLSMSYMGVKAHCLEMDDEGYLETWRQPRKRGRPRMLYRLTEKAYDLFSEEKNDLALSFLTVSKKLFGATAPQKLLMLHYRAVSAKYNEQIKGATTEERAASFARVRHREGYLSDFEEGPPWRIIENHYLYRDLLMAYPEVDAFECQMISEVLGVPVRREVTMVAGLYRAIISSKL